MKLTEVDFRPRDWRDVWVHVSSSSWVPPVQCQFILRGAPLKVDKNENTSSNLLLPITYFSFLMIVGFDGKQFEIGSGQMEDREGWGGDERGEVT